MLNTFSSTNSPDMPVVRELITFHGSVAQFPQFTIPGFLRVVSRHEDDSLTEFLVERWAA